MSFLRQVVEQLTEKCRQLQAELTGRRRELEQLQAEHAGVLAETEALRSAFTRSPPSPVVPLLRAKDNVDAKL